MAGGRKKPICWVDERTHVFAFRKDVTVEQFRELEAIMQQAFNVGLKSGYRQGLKACRQSREAQGASQTQS